MAKRWSLFADGLIAALAVAGFSGFPGVSAQAAETTKYLVALLVFVVAAVIGLVLWWRIYRASPPKEVPQRISQVAAAVADDLTKIEGIGPKISGLLQEAGIRSFADLAAAKADPLREIIAAAGLSGLADPGSWPQQAKLAAEGQWERLQALQDELKGGRRS